MLLLILLKGRSFLHRSVKNALKFLLNSCLIYPKSVNCAMETVESGLKNSLLTRSIWFMFPEMYESSRRVINIFVNISIQFCVFGCWVSITVAKRQTFNITFSKYQKRVMKKSDPLTSSANFDRTLFYRRMFSAPKCRCKSETLPTLSLVMRCH